MGDDRDGMQVDGRRRSEHEGTAVPLHGKWRKSPCSPNERPLASTKFKGKTKRNVALLTTPHTWNKRTRKAQMEMTNERIAKAHAISNLKTWK